MSGNTALYLWVGAVVVLLIVALSSCYLAGAVELHISGSFTGTGNQSLFFTGDNLSAFWNGSILNVTAVV
jgi:hypothetical protein